MEVTHLLKAQVVRGLQEIRKNYTGTDRQFASKHGINPSSYSTLKNGELMGNILKESKWIELANELGINAAWAIVKTEVFEHIEIDVQFCSAESTSLMLIDDQGIGKTAAAKYLSKSLKNCFHIDCTQNRTRIQFAKNFARIIGIPSTGSHIEVKENIKVHLRSLTRPVVILDEAGDLEYATFLEIKEFWNATDGFCGWYMMGADGLRAKFERGMQHRKVGFREMFSRFNGRYGRIVPTNPQERQQFYRKLITDVLGPNLPASEIPAIVVKCLANDAAGESGDLRRTITMIKLRRHERN